MNFVEFELEDSLAIVTLNRPPVNAISLEMYLEIEEMFTRLNYMKEARVVILRAEGKNFSVGNDLKDFQENMNKDARYKELYASKVTKALMSVHNCSLPIVCCVQGHVVGAGCAMAAAGDIIIASEDAVFTIPEIKLGIIGASGFLNLLVPEKVARYMALTGNPCSAFEVKNHGGIAQIVPLERLKETAVDLAKQLLTNPPLALIAFKKAMNLNANFDLEEKYNRELSFTHELSATYDRKEAIMARLEKRLPIFRGE